METPRLLHLTRRLSAFLAGFLLFAGAGTARAATKQAPTSVFQEYQKSLDEKQLWLAPDVTKESPPIFAARLEKEARQGNAKAQATLALCYYFGRGVPRDIAKMVEWTEKAAAQGHAGAQNNLGLLYDEGLGVPHDAVKAHSLFVAAAAQGLPNALFNVGHNYAMGIAVAQDWKEAAAWYRKASDQGYLPAMNNLGNIYMLGRGTPMDLAVAEKLLRKPAEAGIIASQLNLGMALVGAEKLEEAAVWIRRAAVRGYPGAQYVLATLLAHGKGMPRDLREALRWARKAGDSGLPDGNALTARFLMEDKTADPAEVFRLARLAAEKESPRGFAMMGFCYLRGIGVARDGRTAADWFRRSAETGRTDGALNLGLLLESGNTIPRSYADAAKWYRVAAEGGSPEACHRLGLLYRDGTGVKTDLAEAAKWLRLAAKNLKNREVTDALAEVERLIAKAPEIDAEREFRRGVELRKAAEQGENTAAEAAAHFEKAAATGNAPAKAFLAGIYRRGDGVPRDVARSDALIAELAGSEDVRILTTIGLAYLEGREQMPPATVALANSYFRRAAIRGHVRAQNALGYELMISETERDLVEAFKWLTLADRKGVPEAKVNLQRLRGSISMAQMEEGERRADAFQPAPEPKSH